MYVSDSDECFEGSNAESCDREGPGAPLEQAVTEAPNGQQQPVGNISERGSQARELPDLPAKNQEVGCSRKRLYKTQIALSWQSNQEITLWLGPNSILAYGSAT